MSIKSPCINVCKIDRVSGLCYGCARSLEEIGEWGAMTDKERQSIMEQIDERMLIQFGTNRNSSQS